jgi:hypothetical protein
MSKKKHRKCKPSPEDVRLALFKISEMGAGMKAEVIDWANIGNNAISIAKETLREKCVECGK